MELLSTLADQSAGQKVRRSGIPSIGAISWGTHFCQFYGDHDDLLDTLVDYFRAGLEDGERCLWATCEPCGVEQARKELLRRLPNARKALAAEKIEIVACEQWYLEDGQFDPTRVVNRWAAKLDETLAKGYSGLRVLADEGWLTAASKDAFAEYEASIDKIFAGTRVIGLCAHPLADSTAEEVFDIARTHHFAIAHRDGKWEVMEQAETIGAKREVERVNHLLEEQVEQRTRELEEAGAALREREEMYRLLAQSTGDLISIYDLDRRRIYKSPSFDRLLGDLPEEGMAGVHPQDLELTRQAWSRVLAGEPQITTFRHRDADGSWIWLESTARKVIFRGAPHILAVTRNVTERIALEEQLHHAQKMEALGSLAGGVAHDFNNVLTAIFGYSKLAAADLGKDEPACAYVGEIRRAAERAMGLTRQLLTFSRRDSHQPRTIDINKVIAGLDRMLRLFLREDMQLEIRTSPGQLPVHIDPLRLEQVLVNLVLNARDATGPGGRIELVTELAADGPDDLPTGRYARLAVADNGSGIATDIAEQIFEPFFTTKPAGRGTGLGLATVASIIEQNGGRISFEGRKGGGTEFTILLPLSTRDEVAAPSPAEGGDHDIAGLNIMIVEDEDIVRRFICEALRRSGAEVLAFASPEEALPALMDEHQAVDILLADMVLPVMDGPMLARLATRSRPKLKVVLMSGHPVDEEMPADLQKHARFLEKPFSAEDLLDRLAEARAGKA
jgi:PAS domain S-box-containing protein